ncbi:MAG: hypothetical protein RR705_10370 [Lachnospiraceae bacterium]
MEWVLVEPVITFAQGIIDDSIRENAEFQWKAGMEPQIVRVSSSKCCDWCAGVAGTYTYPDVPKDVYRRHGNCRCKVSYDPKNGKTQNVWSKKWSNDRGNDKIEARKVFGLEKPLRREPMKDVHRRTANMSPEERTRAIELWNKYKELPLSQKEKEYIYEELDNNLTIDEKEQSIVHRPIGDHRYTAINKGHNQYKIIQKEAIEQTDDIVNEVLTEMFGADWRKWE